MKLREFDGTKERKVLINQIVSTEFLQKVNFLKDEHFAGAGSKTLHRWCREYYNEYGEAPGKAIMDIYTNAYPENFADNLRYLPDDPEQAYMNQLLTSLNGQWEKKREFNLEWEIKEALNWVNRRQAELLREHLQDALENNRTDIVPELLEKYKPTELTKTEETGEDPFNDPQGWAEAFDNDNQEVLFELPGVWGEFLGEQLYRESLIGILAPEKTGKSYTLLEFQGRALRCGRNVALFEAGDMTKNQRYFRLAQYYTGLPRKRKRPGKDFVEFIDVDWPTDFEGTTESRHLQNLTKELALDSIEKQARRMEKQFKSKLRQAYYTTSTLTFGEVERKLIEWEKEDGFIPDVILVDYPDIMLAENMKQDVRHQENTKWKMARHLSQKYHACVIMVTQADADSYGKEWLVLKNFSESKTKYAHVTCFIGINKNQEDESLNQIRLNYLMPPREGQKHPPIKILQCLECGQPYMKSDWCKRKPDGSISRTPKGNNGDKGLLARQYFLNNEEHYSFKEAAKISGCTEDHTRKIRKQMVADGEL